MMRGLPDGGLNSKRSRAGHAMLEFALGLSVLLAGAYVMISIPLGLTS